MTGRGSGSPVRVALAASVVRLARVPVLLCLLAATGCAGLLPATGSGSGGLPDYERDIRRGLASGHYRDALGALSADSAAIGDELLRLQFLGLAAHYAGQPEASSRAMESAAYLAEERYTRSLSREAMSLLTNDRIRPYRPGDVERLLLHHYGALNYLSAGDPEEAAVEARRLAFMLDRIDDEAPGWSETRAGRSLRSVLRRVTGAVFAAAGEENDADVAYRLARRVAPPGEQVGPTARDPVAGDSTAAAPSRGGGEVILVVEQGFVPYRIERSATVVLGVRDVRRLREEAEEARAAERRTAFLSGAGAAPEGRGDSSAVAVDLAEELLGAASGSRRGGRVRLVGDSDEGVRLLRLAWPELAPPVAARPVRRVRPAGDALEAEPVVSAEGDLAGAVAAEFRDGQVGRLARTLLRAVAKQAAVDAVAEGVGEEDEGWGEALGTAASLLAAAVERADTRSWHLLPARVSVLRVRLPPGEHRLALELETPGADGERRVGLGPVTVRRGRPTVVAHRVWPPAARLDGRAP